MILKICPNLKEPFSGPSGSELYPSYAIFRRYPEAYVLYIYSKSLNHNIYNKHLLIIQNFPNLLELIPQITNLQQTPLLSINFFGFVFFKIGFLNSAESEGYEVPAGHRRTGTRYRYWPLVPMGKVKLFFFFLRSLFFAFLTWRRASENVDCYPKMGNKNKICFI